MMRTFARSSVVLALALAAIAAVLTPLGAQDRDDPRVIMISIDGLKPSSYTDPSSNAPTLRALAQSGVWAEGVVGVLPTVTYPSHTTLVTGVDPAVHGIVDNRIFDPEGRSNGAWFYYARDIKVPTLAMAARSRGLRAGAVTWPVTVGMDLDYNVPEFFRSNHPENVTMLRALSSPRTLMDAVEATRGKPFGWPQTDRDRTDLTTFILKNFDPHVMLLHLIDMDDTQHKYGPGTPEAAATLARVDALVGEIVATVKAAGRADRTNIAIVSDHGFLPTKMMLQPNTAFKNEGLLKVDDRGRVTEWQAYYHASGGAGFVYVKDQATVSKVQTILERLKSDPANGIRSLWDRTELAARGAHPSAAFGMDFVDGFYSGEGHDGLVKASGSKGGHGFAPDRPALHASFIMAGPNVKARGSIGVIRMTQIAPTLASILRVGLSPVAGKPLDILSSSTPSGSGQ
jgi:predicted AlkP superfamily pyrophosphatase or phosphodiesterase